MEFPFSKEDAIKIHDKLYGESESLNESDNREIDKNLRALNVLLSLVSWDGLCDIWAEYNPDDKEYEIRSKTTVRHFYSDDMSKELSSLEDSIKSMGIKVYIFAPWYVDSCEDEVKFMNESSNRSEKDTKKLFRITKMIMEDLILPEYNHLICSYEITLNEVFNIPEVTVLFIGGYGTKLWPMTQGIRQMYLNVLEDISKEIANYTGVVIGVRGEQTPKCDDEENIYLKESESKNKEYSPAGKEVTPKEKVYHQSNPIFRNKIEEQGLKVRAGECYKIYVGYGEKCIPAIFATNSSNKRAWFDSTYDDDVWEIDTTKIPNVKWFKDRHFDSRREIDVSGVSKIAELDGVDESFFELTEVDLRNIDLRISNIQNGVMEFEDCENVKLPVDYENIIDELIGFRENDNLTTEEQVQNIINITNSLFENPDWKVFLPTNVDLQAAVNKDIIKQIAVAVAGSVLSPKVLFPIFVLLRVVQNDATGLYNQVVTSANTYIQSGNTISGQVNNIVNNQVDFLKTFESFNIQVTSKIGAIFIKQLFELLKKDIINLLSSVVKDIAKGRLEKKYLTVQRLTDIALIIQQVARGVDDYRKCKSLVDDILIILKLLSGFAPPGSKIPAALLLLADFLPGTSAERSSINAIKELQSFGVPTGTLPDGSPNLMLLYNLASNKAAEKEKAQNGKVELVAVSAAGPVKVSGVLLKSKSPPTLRPFGSDWICVLYKVK